MTLPAVAAPNLHVGPTPQPPVIDGKLDDACWREATLFSGFIDINGVWAPDQTTAYVTYDDLYLYVAFRCNEHEMDLIRETVTEDDQTGILTDDDAIEFFLDANHDQKTYYQFGINSFGARYDAAWEASGTANIDDDGWDAIGEVKTSKGSDRWRAEMQISFESLGVAQPRPGETWGVNFNRGRRAGGSDGIYSSWAAVAHGFHRPEGFGTVVFGKPAALSYSVLSLGNPQSTVLRLLMRNGSDAAVEAESSWSVEPSWTSPFRKASNTMLQPDSDREAVVSYDLAARQLNDVPLGPTGDLTVTLSVVNHTAGETVDEKTGTMNWGEGRIMDLALDRYYYTPDVRQARVEFTRETDAGTSFRVEVRKCLDGPALIEAIMPLEQNSVSVPIAIGELAVGRYIVAAHLLDKEGTSLHSIYRVFIKKDIRPAGDPPRAAVTTIRPDGILLRNGDPFCPFMGMGNVESPLGQDCFNVRYGRAGLVAKPLDRPKLGLPWITTEGGKYFIVMPEEEPMYRSIRGTVENRMNDPSMLCFLTKVEAWIPMFRGEERVRVNNVEELKRIREFIKQIDPDRLTSVQVDQAHQLPSYVGVADIVEVAYKSSSFAQRLIPNLVRDLEEIKGVLQEGQPFFFWIGSSIPRPELRSAEDIRCATYLALLYGAAGIVYHMGHDGVPVEDTRHWSVYPGLSREVDEVFAILATEQEEPPPAITVSPDSIDYRVRRVDGRVVLVAVNTADTLVEAAVSIGNAHRVVLPFESRVIEADDSGFTDSFTAYEPHVYTCTPGIQ